VPARVHRKLLLRRQSLRSRRCAAPAKSPLAVRARNERHAAAGDVRTTSAARARARVRVARSARSVRWAKVKLAKSTSSETPQHTVGMPFVLRGRTAAALRLPVVRRLSRASLGWWVTACPLCSRRSSTTGRRRVNGRGGLAAVVIHCWRMNGGEQAAEQVTHCERIVGEFSQASRLPPGR